MTNLILNQIVTDKAIQDFKTSITCKIHGPISDRQAKEMMHYQAEMSILLSLYGACRPSLN